MSSKAVDHFIRFCTDANIDHKNMTDSMRKYLLAYQRNILHRVAFTALFENGRGPLSAAAAAAGSPSVPSEAQQQPPSLPLREESREEEEAKEQGEAKANADNAAPSSTPRSAAAVTQASYINWDYIERNLPRLDCPHWIAIFRYIDFGSVPRDKSVLQSIDRHLKALGLESHSLTCQVFLLKNTNFITSQLGVERLLCEHEVADPYTKSLRFFAMSADAAFDITETTAVFCHIMRHCRINEAELERQILFVQLREEELIASFRMKQIRMIGVRPRLRSKLTTIQREARSVFDMYTFVSWGQAIRFPTVFSLHTKHKLYFLMSQVHVPDPLAHVSSITRDGHVNAALRTAVVHKPEADILHKVITSLKLIEEPFKELQDFRCECMNAFPVTQLNALRLNDVLHLYVCAYQNVSVWKDIWKQLIPLLSHQVIRDVEAFVQRRPFNHEAVLGIMNSC